ncbi:MAG: DUF58 domain-containing protein [Planctomycetes bacterium]|nr:DUF58 domain-containing protein [Planctomycetota bacterium]
MREALRQSLIAGETAGARYALSMPRRVPMGLTGAQVGQHAGSSLEFKEHREYQPGDDLRRIDWSAYARSDRLNIKLYREEVTPHVDLLIDGSASMDLPDSRKAEGTLGAAASITAAATNSSYTHATYLAGEGCTPVLRGADAPTLWDHVDFTHAGSLAESMQQAPPSWRSQSIRVIISDLLFMSDPLAVLAPIAARASVLLVVQVLAQADVDPPQRGSVRLADSETGELREVFIDAGAQERYRAALAQHQENWSRAATQVGATMVTIVAERLLATWDMSPLIEAAVMRVP